MTKSTTLSVGVGSFTLFTVKVWFHLCGWNGTKRTWRESWEKCWVNECEKVWRLWFWGLVKNLPFVAVPRLRQPPLLQLLQQSTRLPRCWGWSPSQVSAKYPHKYSWSQRCYFQVWLFFSTHLFDIFNNSCCRNIDIVLISSPLLDRGARHGNWNSWKLCLV